MTKINLFINALLLFIALIFSAISECSCLLSNKRLCYDPECSEPVSLAKTTLRYNPNEPGLLAFDINVNVTVYSKGAGNRTDLWGIEINGKRGYAPKAFMREYRILHKTLKHEVPISLTSDNKLSYEKPLSKQKNIEPSIEASESTNENIKSSDKQVANDVPISKLNGASPTYEVIDGTTIKLDHNEPTVQPSFVTEVLPITAVPNNQEKIDIPGVLETTHKENVANIFVKPKLSEVDQNSKEIEKHESSKDIQEELILSSSKEVISSSEDNGIVTDTPALRNTADTNSANNGEANTQLNGIATLAMATEAQEKVTNGNSDDPNQKLDVQPEESKESSSSNNATESEQPKTIQDEKVDSLLKNDADVKNEIQSDSETIVKENQENSKSIMKTIMEAVIPMAKGINTEIPPKEEIPNVTVDNVLLNSEPKEKPTVTEAVLDRNTTDAIASTSSADLESASEKKIEETSESVSKVDAPVQNHIEQTPTVVVTEIDITLDINRNSVVNEQDKDSSSIKNNSDTMSSTQTNTSLNESTPSEKQKLVEEESVPDLPRTTELNGLNESTPLEKPELLKEESVPDLQHTTELNDLVDSEETVEETNTTEVTTTVTSEKIEELTTPVNITIDTPIDFVSTEVPTLDSDLPNSDTEPDLQVSEPPLYSSHIDLISEQVSDFNEFRNRNLLNVEKTELHEIENTVNDETELILDETLPGYGADISSEDKVLDNNFNLNDAPSVEETTIGTSFQEVQVSSPDVCTIDSTCESNDNIDAFFETSDENSETEENAVMGRIIMDHNYWLMFMYLTATAATVLLFSLGYYYIENMRRDRQLIAKINKLEKELLVATKECTMLSENLVVTKEKLSCIEDESFGSNEMVLSLKADLEASQNMKVELEDQIAMLEKDLESATEAGLELERMLREVLSSNNEVNPLAESVEDLQARLNAQQAENESLTSALNLKVHENEALSTNLASATKRFEKLEVEVARVRNSLKDITEKKYKIEQSLTDKVQRLEMQLKEISTEKSALQKELKNREVELNELSDVINQLKGNNLDLNKLYDVSRIKAETVTLLEERDELRERLSEVEGAHNLLEEHTKRVAEDLVSLTELYKAAEKEKEGAETRLEVLTNFFNEREAQRQKEEAVWLQKQGEVVSTVERIQAMQNEIHNYKQQIEMLRREILDQEREYKGQISVVETKAHEQWVIARQMERRLEESKSEAGQLRNRLTLIEKNINDMDPEAKLHRLEGHEETATSPPLFIGADSSSSPIMFSGSSGVPPPPPPYMHCSMFPPYMPPPLPSSGAVLSYEVGQRPPPLGGRLSSPPPMPLHGSAPNRYDNTNSPPPPMSPPHLLPPYNHRSPPPPFGSDHLHHHPHPHPHPPPPGSILPPPLGTAHSWGEESLPPVRNSGFQPHQREQRLRNHKGSLHSSGESLDKPHHSTKV